MSLSAEEKIRVLEKKVRRMERLIERGAMAQYLFCPSLNCWLPAQCDPEGRQVIDPSDLDTRYHKKGEDVDLESNVLKFSQVMLREYPTDKEYLEIINLAGGPLRNLRLWNIVANQVTFAQLYGGLQNLFLHWSTGKILYGKRHTTEVFRTVGNDFQFNYNLAILGDLTSVGDVTGLAGKTLTFPSVIGTAGYFGTGQIYSLADTGDAYVYVDAAGNLKRGSAYP